MWQDIWNSVVGSPTQSPEPERANQVPPKNTNDLKEYLDWYFSDLNKQYKNNKSSEREKDEAKNKLGYFSFPEIVPPQLSLASPTEIIKYLVDNINSLTPEILKIKDNNITDKDIQNLSNYLRNNKTVKEVHLVNCQMNNKKVKILADIFKLNKTITTLSLSNNKDITNIGVKTLLKLKESSPNLKCVKVGFYDTNNAYCPAVNIFNIDIATESSPLFHNQIIRQDSLINKDAKLELQSIAKSYNEITGKGNTQNMVVVAGEIYSGKTVTAIGLSGITALINREHKIETFSTAINKKIHHTSSSFSAEVNNFPTSINNTKIIELHGIGDNQEDTFSNAYNFWQTFESGENIKFLLIFNGYLFNNFISGIRQFLNIFTNSQNQLLGLDFQSFVSIIFRGDFGAENIKAIKIKEIKEKLASLNTNNNLKDHEKAIIKSLEERTFFINHPQVEGNYSEIPHISEFQELVPLTGVKIKNTLLDYKKITQNKTQLSAKICDQVYENIGMITVIIQSFFEFNKNKITDPFKSFYKLDLHKELYYEMFIKNYDEIKYYLPENPLNRTTAQPLVNTSFPALKELKELTNARSERFENPSDKNIQVICSFLETIRKFCNTPKDKDILGDYVYVLKQQYVASLFCKRFNPTYTHPDHCKAMLDIASKILITGKLLNEAILNMKLTPYKDSGDIEINQQQIPYYENAIKWLKKFKGQDNSSISVINELKANAHYYLGRLYESNGCLAGSAAKLHWLCAIREYIEALKIEASKMQLENGNIVKKDNFVYGQDKIIFGDVCGRVGELLLKLGKYYNNINQTSDAIYLINEAIKYFMTGIKEDLVNVAYPMLEEILNDQPRDKRNELKKELYKSLGEFFVKLGLNVEAARNFGLASSLTEEDAEKQVLKAKKNENLGLNVKPNTIFLDARSESGRDEDLTVKFSNVYRGIASLIDTKLRVKTIINPPEEEYNDPYDNNPPEPAAPPRPVEAPTQWHLINNSPIPNPVLPPRSQNEDADQNVREAPLEDDSEDNNEVTNWVVTNHQEVDNQNQSENVNRVNNENVELVRNLVEGVPITDEQFNLLNAHKVLLDNAIAQNANVPVQGEVFEPYEDL